MSSFPGKMREYDKISLDRFDNYKGSYNLKSTVYFLSHFHKDHTVGLSSDSFFERMKMSRKVFIYCTEVTKILMLADDHYKHLEKYVKTLEVDVPTRIVIPDEYTDKDEYITVTLIPAGHCPGSVMFLIEGTEGTVLYTGDFRWEGNEVTRVPWFRSGDSIKDIRSLYVDTTFCIPEAFYIPSRADCVEALYELVKNWIGESPNNCVNISSKTKYGHEHLLKGVADKLDKKIHVLADKHQLYEQIPELQNVFTSDPSATPIHACCWEPDRDTRSRLPCGFVPANDTDVKVMVVRPSTMWFTQGVQIKDIYVKTHYIHRVCYSFHSSFSEVRDFVTFLKPRRVYPNVVPPNQTVEQIQARLNQFLSLIHKDRASGDDQVQTKPLGILRKVKSTKQYSGSLTDSEELCFDDEKTPKKRSRRASAESIQSNKDSSEKFQLYYSQFLRDRTPDGSQEKALAVVISPCKSSNESASSYSPSCHSDSEMDLTGSGNVANVTMMKPAVPDTGGSYMSYMSDDDDDDCDNANVESLSSAECEKNNCNDVLDPSALTVGHNATLAISVTEHDRLQNNKFVIGNSSSCERASLSILDVSDADSDITVSPENVALRDQRDDLMLDSSPDEVEITYCSVRSSGKKLNENSTNSCLVKDFQSTSPLKSELQNRHNLDLNLKKDSGALKSCKRPGCSNGTADSPAKIPKLSPSISPSPRGVIHSPLRRRPPVAQKVILVDLTADSDSDDNACVIWPTSDSSVNQ
ncbi:protein artemis-like [Liolophura sinensis]|uniref:protein artemis-like n=1 Tax=Liolophura sinensis TaxID=3198878 RepID=UPI0031593D69